MITRILVPLDGSEFAERALPVAASIARATGAAIDVVLVHERSPVRTDREETVMWRAEDVYLDRLARALADDARVQVASETIAGSPAHAICARAADRKADLVVMSSHGRTGFNRLWLGSVADAVMRQARVPVLLVRVDPALAHPRAVRRVLVALDGSALAREALAPAADLAQAFGASVVLLRLVQPVPQAGAAIERPMGAVAPGRDEAATRLLLLEAERDLEAIAGALRASGVAVDVHVAVGDHPAQAIVEWSRGCELVAIATHGRGMSRLVTGSVADKVIRATETAILIVRPAPVSGAAELFARPEIEAQLPAVSGG